MKRLLQAIEKKMIYCKFEKANTKVLLKKIIKPEWKPDFVIRILSEIGVQLLQLQGSL